nr:hypothetical protein [Evansella caseinilytica]
MKKNNKLILISLVIIGAVIGGVMFMNRGDFAEGNREAIEENVRNYVERYKLNPDDVDIYNIGNPTRFPTGEEEFDIYIKHMGHPYFRMVLKGDPDTLLVFEPKEHIIELIFEEIYLEARYEELKPTIDYLNSLNITDPLRPEGTKIQYFQTSVGLATEINAELKKAFKSGEDLEHLKQYIENNLEQISELDTNIRINGIIDELDDEKANEIEKKLKELLPKSNYVVRIGVDSLESQEHEKIDTYLIIE